MMNQSELLEESWDWLILLDGCRYDAMEYVQLDYIDGELIEADNGGYAFTANWFHEHLSGEYDMPFFHGGQPIHAFDHNPHGYDERDHFRNVPDWERYEWGNEEIDTSLPSGVIDVVEEEMPSRGVVRFIQPHNPYLSMPEIRGSKNAMKYSTGQLWDAYEENLRWVMEEITDGFISNLPGKVVITSDHGQALGERCCGQYLHGPDMEKCECLTTVPWLIV